ncbi:MAG TPA: CPBP family intramembrane metalloprotease [Verrucomicrobiae bacterium]|nr:CPBP family intramembrane metalloprotease [Verrucomicrobiae bacterium]
MKKAAVFLGLTFVLSWPVAFLCFGSGMRSHTVPWLAAAVYFMFTPAIATIITQKLIFRQDLMGPLRVSFRPNGWFLVALLLPGIIALASTATSLFFPDVSLATDLTETSFFLFLRQSITQDQAAALARSAGELPVHPFFIVLLGGTMAGLTINGVAGFGEELGWRGLLLRELAGLGFWRASFATGIVWGLWHLPFILHGYNYPGYPIAGTLVMIVWTILFSPLIGYLCIRANSVIAAAMMHGAVNGTAMAPMVMLRGGNALQIGVLGFAGILVLLCLNLVLVTLGRPEEWHSKWRDRTIDDAARP